MLDIEEKNPVVYRSFYETFQLLIDHRVETLLRIRAQVQHNDDEDFLGINYETVPKLFEQMVVDHQLIKMYYRFANRTSPALFCRQTRELFDGHLTKKIQNK